MKVPSKEDLYKNQYHMEFLSVDGEWKRLDTFTFYEFDRAVNLVINRFLKTETHHRLVDKDGKVVVLLDDTLIEEDNERMDIIGQNGNDGLHYDLEDNEKKEKNPPGRGFYRP